MLTDLQIKIPTQKEQKEIGAFISDIDHIFTLHQLKHDALLKAKQFYLQNLFPRKGEKTPRLRFEGFSGEWERHQISEVADIVGGGTPSTNHPEYWDGDIDWYAPAEINNQIYVDRSARRITKLGLEKSSARILPADRTILFTSRAGIGKTAILKHPAATNQGFQSMVLNDNANPYFVFSMTQLIKEEAERVASGSTFSEISGKMLGKLVFLFPSRAEQNAIGEYLEHLDQIITLQTRKLETLKRLKQFMLQNLFV